MILFPAKSTQQLERLGCRREFPHHFLHIVTTLACAACIALFTQALCASLLKAESADRPNFVLIIADDISYNDIGCYGSPNARTPRLDELARESLLITNAFLTASSCSPSRSSIVTSRYPHNTGEALQLHEKISWHLPSVTGVLRDAGYYTALSGKNHMAWHAPPPGEKAPTAAFDKIDYGIPKPPLKHGLNTGGHANWVTAIQSRPQNKPFMLWLASYDAHRDWDGDRQWIADQYGPRHDPRTLSLPPAFVDTDATRQDFASYLNEVTRFDYFVGEVVDELKKQELWDNTYLFVMADNGRPFPRAKTRMIDDGMKTFLLLTGPALRSPGISSDALVSVIDIAPTILDFAGADVPCEFQGRTMRPLYEDPNASIRPLAFAEHNWHDFEALGRSVRDQHWLYIENDRPQFSSQGPADSVRSPTHQDLRSAASAGSTLSPAQADVLRAPRPRRELYHRVNDRFQTRNLIDDPKNQAIARSMARALATWRDQTADSSPTSIRPDFFDREMGTPLKLGKQKPQLLRRPWPGGDRGADQVNAEGLESESVKP